jgi:class I fructose-bisphosphate aldolase/fructose-bisphosphate aldolase/6-deoxy-5-ketofructose 1-phosphate synthase
MEPIDRWIPADVPADRLEAFRETFQRATDNTGRLMLMAGDQKVEHLNQDFFGTGIAADDANPAHLFRIAAGARIGVFATQMGLISRYAPQFPHIPYLVKLNAKTNIVPFQQKDPLSSAWFTVPEVVDFARTASLNLVGVGYTIYPGSEYEAAMLREAARIVHEAHRHGLIAVLWAYPKGKAVADEHDPHLIAGAAGLAACLGADFVKVKVPYRDRSSSPGLLSEAIEAAGTTGVICEGGSRQEPGEFLGTLYEEIHEGKARGSGTGRNIHQRPLRDAIALANAIHAVTVEDKTVEEALALL